MAFNVKRIVQIINNFSCKLLDDVEDFSKRISNCKTAFCILFQLIQFLISILFEKLFFVFPRFMERHPFLLIDIDD